MIFINRFLTKSAGFVHIQIFPFFAFDSKSHGEAGLLLTVFLLT